MVKRAVPTELPKANLEANPVVATSDEAVMAEYAPVSTTCN